MTGISRFNLKIRLLQLVNHLAMFYGFYAIYQGLSPWYLFFAFIFYCWFQIIGVGVSLHRYYCHRSFTASKLWQYIMAITGTLCTVGSILGFAGLHRYHHLHTDTEKDPHDPRRLGIFRVWFYLWEPSKLTKKFIRTELQDKLVMFLHNNYYKVIFSYILILAVIDPWLVIWCYCVPANGSYLFISALTVIGHLHGYTTHQIDNSSRNSWIANILSLGEGWHNNHHAQPWNHRQGQTWWEFDPPAWVIENFIDRSKK